MKGRHVSSILYTASRAVYQMDAHSTSIAASPACYFDNMAKPYPSWKTLDGLVQISREGKADASPMSNGVIEIPITRLGWDVRNQMLRRDINPAPEEYKFFFRL